MFERQREGYGGRNRLLRRGRGESETGEVGTGQSTGLVGYSKNLGSIMVIIGIH